jgi:hypothetical protein
MTGITASLQCDPLTKRETWLFQEIGRANGGPAGSGGAPLYRRLQYNLVSFDGDPTQYLEPAASAGDFTRSLVDGSATPIDPRVDGCGLIVGFQFCTARPFEVFALNDFDAVNNGGQLS